MDRQVKRNQKKKTEKDQEISVQSITAQALGIAESAGIVCTKIGGAIATLQGSPATCAQVLCVVEDNLEQMRDAVAALADQCVDLDIKKKSEVQGVSKGGIVDASGNPIGGR